MYYIQKITIKSIIPFLISPILERAPLWLLYLLLVLFGVMSLILLVMLCFQLYLLFLEIRSMFKDWLKRMRKY